MPPTRFRGDGLDLRSPIMSTQRTHDIIDLTEDSSPATSNLPRIQADRSDYHVQPSHIRTSVRPSRGPRYNRNIVNPEPEESTRPTVDLRDSSPEVQFIRERPLPMPQGDRNPGRHRAPPRQPDAPLENLNQPGRGGSIFPTITGAIASRLGPLDITRGFIGRRIFGTPDQLVAIDGMDVRDYNGIDMGVNMRGFNLDNPSRPVPQPRLPTYEPPPPAREGFTRDLNEDDELICPKCDDELGVGDNDTKRQVWVIKACGHVRAIFSSAGDLPF